MFFIVGLGNPGSQYKWTRHNVGFEVIDKLSYDYNINVNKNKFKANFGEGIIKGKKVMLIKPMTYMNLSGEAVRDILGYYKGNINELIVICDDVNIPVGDIRIRAKGSAGGQKGMENIIYHIENDCFARIRVGIGPKPNEFDLKNFVLSKFKKSEDNDIINALTDAAKAAEEIICDSVKGVNNAMNLFNKRLKNET